MRYVGSKGVAGTCASVLNEGNLALCSTFVPSSYVKCIAY